MTDRTTVRGAPGAAVEVPGALDGLSSTHRRGGPSRRKASADPPGWELGRSKRETYLLGIGLVLPAMVPFVLFLLLPVGVAFWYSFQEATGYSRAGEFVGLDNYVRALTDGVLWAAVLRNIILALVNIIIAVGVGFLLAYWIFRRVAGWRFLQAGLFIPYVLPVAVIALLWTFVADANFGLLNAALEAAGFEALTHDWLGSQDTALGSVTLVWAWRLAPFMMLILYGAMLRIPEEMTEAAQLDGAGEWRMMTRIVYPLVRPTVALSVLITGVVTFRTFDMVWILTQGGPQGATRIATLYVYEQGFVYNNFGYANALAFVVAALIIVPALLVTRSLNRTSN